MNAKLIMCAGALALAAEVFASAVATGATVPLLVAAGGGGGVGAAGLGGAGQITSSGQAGGGGAGGAGGVNGLGGGGGGAGWLGDGSTGTGIVGFAAGGGGLSYPTFAGGAGGVAPVGGATGGFGGGGGGSYGAGGGGGYSGGGGGIGGFDSSEGGGGGGSYANPALTGVLETPGFNGSANVSEFGVNGYVIVGFDVFYYTGSIVQYTIPQTGYYYVAAIGAQGGAQPTVGAPIGRVSGGYGAAVGGTVFLDQGTLLDILVGGGGEWGVPGAQAEGIGGGSGGGGSFVWDPSPLPAQPVPEPSTWALMIVGFSVLCVLARRRRKAVMTA